MRPLLVALALLFALAPSAISSAPASASSFTLVHHPVTTARPDAQAAFDEGLTLLYAFNPQEAERRFARAARLDPGLAMAEWGIALAHAGNITASPTAADWTAGHAAIVRAAQLSADGEERALVEAVAARFPGGNPSGLSDARRAYRNAMAALVARYPDDLDAATLYAESLLDIEPSGRWTADGRPIGVTARLVQTLRSVLARDPGHPGAAHYYIHAVEASPHPEEALDAARRLSTLEFEPAAEHLAHMPAHIFMRVGDYDAAARCNENAIALFHAYLRHDHAAGHEWMLNHDLAFLASAAAMAGEFRRARAAAQEFRERTGSPSVLAEVLVRFRRWEEAAGIPGESITATFARGMSFAARGEVARAERVLAELPDDAGEAKVARAVLAGEIDAARHHIAAAIDHLQRAVAAEDRLDYSEPPAWFSPVREALGAAYFAAGRYPEAERVFRDDLARNARNGRSLFGLAQTLAREGRAADAAATETEFTAAWQHADVDLAMKDL